MALVSFNSKVVLLFLNNIIVLINRSYLSAAQASYSFQWLDMHTSMLTTPIFKAEAICLVTLLQLAILKDCCSKVMAYSYSTSLICFHNPYGC